VTTQKNAVQWGKPVKLDSSDLLYTSKCGRFTVRKSVWWSGLRSREKCTYWLTDAASGKRLFTSSTLASAKRLADVSAKDFTCQDVDDKVRPNGGEQ
jgi:hypothetical protein